jgi:hypothetical protein
MPGTPRWWPAVEAVLLLAVTLPLALLIGQPSLWFLIPFALITLRGRDYAAYGLDLSARSRWGGLGFHAAMVFGIFVPYLLGHIGLARMVHGSRFALTLPDHFGGLLIEQLLGVALPEEFFFRGYLQSQFNRSFSRRLSVFGAPCGVGLLLAAALFAACHVPLGGPGQLIVFFPGLWYGWLRERTDSVVIPTVYHALSNVLLRVVVVSLVPA